MACWKRSPSARSRAQRRPFVPRHVSHTFRAQISSSFMKPRFIFAHCNVPVGSGNTGKRCQCRGNIPLPHTHYGVKTRSHRLGGPEAWLWGTFFLLNDPPMPPFSSFYLFHTLDKNGKKATSDLSLFLKSDKQAEPESACLGGEKGDLFSYQMDHPWTSKQVCQGGLKYEQQSGGGDWRLAGKGIRGEGELSITRRRHGSSKHQPLKAHTMHICHRLLSPVKGCNNICWRKKTTLFFLQLYWCFCFKSRFFWDTCEIKYITCECISFIWYFPWCQAA